MPRSFLSAASRAFSTAFRLFGGINVETITANKTLDFASSNVQVLNPSTGSRDINLMVLEGTGLGCRTDGLPFLFKNSGSSGHDLVIKDSDGSTVTTVDQGQWALVMGDGASWRVVVAPTISMLTLATDTITEATAAAGVTVDGALIKDGDFRPVDSDGVIFGTGSDITMTWDGTRFTVTQAAPNSEIRWGVDAAGIDQMWYGDTASTYMTWDQSADSLIFADNAKLVFGTGSDITVLWDATKLVVSQAAPNSAVEWGVDGAGIDQVWYGDTASAKFTFDQSADAFIRSGVVVDHFTQAGTGTGTVIEVVGPDLTHGLKRVVQEVTLTPAAIETALLTLPANSYVESLQANIQAALTGGGTTTTVSFGITGDVDAYGTMFSGGAQSDLLTQNAKADFVGRIAAGAGASLGVFAPSAVSIKMIGAATGGASAGDTALTVGSVKVRITYVTMMSMANA